MACADGLRSEWVVGSTKNLRHSLTQVRAAVQGKYSLPHFASKAHVMDYVEETHGDMIGIYPAVAAFYTNVIHYAPPRRVCIQKHAKQPRC